MRPFLAQTRMELIMTLRQSESLLVTMFIPAGLLIFLAKVPLFDLPDDRVAFLLPGILAIAMMAISMVSLGIATGFERRYGVLKRLALTPLSRPALVASKIAAVSAIEILQLVVLTSMAAFLGWRASGMNGLTLLIGFTLGTLAFGGIGLTLAGSLKAELNLALLNGLFVALMLTGGAVFPIDRLPALMERAVRFLPLHPVADMLRAGSIGERPSISSLLVLLAWAVTAPLLAMKTFLWE